MKIESNRAFEEMLRLFLDFEGKSPSNQLGEWQRVEDYVTRLAKSGWTRKNIYDLVFDIDKRHASVMPVECSDAIGNYITGLIGDVAVEYIVRLPGEMGNLDEHAFYVRSQKWM